MAGQLPPDFFVKLLQFTKTTHRDTYPAVASSSSSQAGKTVIVTGASQGIGKGIAVGFAKAGAKRIFLVGRTESKLQAVAEELKNVNGGATKTICLPADVTDVAAVNKLFETVSGELPAGESVDVLVNSAGAWYGDGTIVDSDPVKWWGDFEVNLKGSYLTTRAFLKLVPKEAQGYIVNVASFGALLVAPGNTSYAISKLAQLRLTEFTAAENPNVQSICYHPGTIETGMTDFHEAFRHFSKDTMELAAAVAVYLATPECAYLNGRYISANWDVDELKARKEEITSKDLLKVALKGEFGEQQFA